MMNIQMFENSNKLIIFITIYINIFIWHKDSKVNKSIRVIKIQNKTKTKQEFSFNDLACATECEYTIVISESCLTISPKIGNIFRSMSLFCAKQHNQNAASTMKK